MTAIRAVYDGKAFIPQQVVSLPNQAEAIVLIEGTDSPGQRDLDAAVRAYYQGARDSDDDAWGRAVAEGSHRAWDED